MSDDEEEPARASKKEPFDKTVSNEEILRVYFVLWLWTNRACPDTVVRRSTIVEETTISADMRYMPYPVATQLVRYLSDVDFKFFLERFIGSSSRQEVRDDLRNMLKCVEGTQKLLNIVGVPTLVRHIRAKPWYRKLDEWTAELEELHRRRHADPAGTARGQHDWPIADRFLQAGKRGGAPAASPVWRLIGERFPEGDMSPMGTREWNMGISGEIFQQRQNFLAFIRNSQLTHWEEVPTVLRTDPEVLAVLVERPPPIKFESEDAIRHWFRVAVDEDLFAMLIPFIATTP